MKAKSIKGKSPEEIKMALAEGMAAMVFHIKYWIKYFNLSLVQNSPVWEWNGFIIEL